MSVAKAHTFDSSHMLVFELGLSALGRVDAVIGDGMISLQSDLGLVTVCKLKNDHLPVITVEFQFVQVKEIIGTEQPHLQIPIQLNLMAVNCVKWRVRQRRYPD